jgi:multiple antibiotic resistance protein
VFHLLAKPQFCTKAGAHLSPEGSPTTTASNMVHKFFVAFIPMFVAIDAIGLVAMFLGLAGDTPREQRQREGFVAVFTALCISIGFIFLGKIIFTALGITVADFQVAGGLILLGIAGRELLNVSRASREATDDFGVVPLGMPLIAGPALLTALLVLVDTVGLVFTVAALLANLALVVVAFMNADLVARWMGRQGLRGVSKIVALLLAAIAVSLIRRGWHGV